MTRSKLHPPEAGPAALSGPRPPALSPVQKLAASRAMIAQGLREPVSLILLKRWLKATQAGG